MIAISGLDEAGFSPCRVQWPVAFTFIMSTVVQGPGAVHQPSGTQCCSISVLLPGLNRVSTRSHSRRHQWPHCLLLRNARQQSTITRVALLGESTIQLNLSVPPDLKTIRARRWPFSSSWQPSHPLWPGLRGCLPWPPPPPSSTSRSRLPWHPWASPWRPSHPSRPRYLPG